jgi:hypothetical protein
MEPEGLYTANQWIVAACMLLVILAGSEVGRWLGGRVLARKPGTQGARIEAFENALLGLLSLMIGFTFSLALNRFEQRKAVVLSDANAIGTVALRARLLPEPHAAQAARLVREYTDARLALGAAPYASPERKRAIDTSLRLQDSLWREAVAATALDARSVPIGLFTDATNHLIDMHETRVTADRNHVPEAALLLLYGIATVAMGFAGYTSALAGTRNRVPVTIMALTIVTVITLVMDLDRPRRGFVTVSQQPMVDLRAGL